MAGEQRAGWHPTRERIIQVVGTTAVWAIGTVAAVGTGGSIPNLIAFVAAAAALHVGLSWRRLPSLATLAIEVSQLWFAAAGTFVAALLLRQLVEVPVAIWQLAVIALCAGFVSAVISEVAAARAVTGIRRAVIIGTGEEAREWMELVEAHPEMGVDIVGCIGNREKAEQVGIGDRWLGPLDDMTDVLVERNVDMPIVSVTSFRRPNLQDVVSTLLEAGHDVGMSWGVGRLSSGRLARQTFSHEVVPVIKAHRPSPTALAAKRVLDVVIAGVVLTVTAPIVLLFALLVRLSSSGPAFFRQDRVGLHGETFRIIKLRTMVDGAADDLDELRDANQRTGPLFKMSGDPRITRVGSVLRKTSIDELPQLVNVLRGEMSLVGPRPALPEESEQFDDELLLRDRVRPGITGLWQVEARSNGSFHAYKRLDLHYLENWSLILDLRVMVATAHVLTIGTLVGILTRGRATGDSVDAVVENPEPRSVAVLGAGYVGLTQAVGLASLGHDVECVDINEARVAELQAGLVPIMEAGLDQLMHEAVQSGRLRFTSDPVTAAGAAEFVFLCVPTPQGDDGSANLQYLQAAAQQIAPCLQPNAVVINKSTVPVGSAEQVADWMGRADVEVISNPEFLREGTAVHDWLNPDRIVVGGDREAAERVLDLYVGLPGERVLCDSQSSELIKYASNAYLATRLTFVNSISELCERVGADALEVTRAMGLDGRIGPRYLQPGPGWGGSCLPKDTRALAHQAQEAGIRFDQLTATIAVNDEHYDRSAERILRAAGPRPVVAALGLTFKADTDDTRDSPALKIIDRLLARGATVQAFDPGVLERPRDEIVMLDTAVDAARGADVLVVLTEWEQFGQLDLKKISEVMNRPAVVDLRNMLAVDELDRLDFEHEAIGRRPKLARLR